MSDMLPTYAMVILGGIFLGFNVGFYLRDWLDRKMKPIEVPIPTLMFCPRCEHPHVDEGQWAMRPHHEHLCMHCSFRWRVEPYVVGRKPNESDLKRCA